MIAGSTGLAGYHLILKLVKDYPGVFIRAVKHRNESPKVEGNNVEYIRGDLRIKEFCSKAAEGCDYAVMAAANTSGVNILANEPWRQVNDNLIMDAQMLEAFHFAGVKKVIFISSAVVYQDFNGFIREDQLDLNTDPHFRHFGVGWTMRSIEKLCEFWSKTYGMKVIIARASNIFGAYDKFDLSTSHFIPALIRKACDKMEPFEVWGSPNVIRDVIYVEDFVRALIKMMLIDTSDFDIYNIGSGVKTKVSDVVDWALKYSGHRPGCIQYSEDKPTSVGFRAIDIGKAKAELQWKPEYSVEQGVEKTVKWWMENKNQWHK